MTLTTTLGNNASLDTPLVASSIRHREQIQALLKYETTVTAMPGYYLVTFPKEVYPCRHLVRKDKTCTCDLGAECPAVLAVANYLKAGGERAADLPACRFIPATCPICGGQVKFAPRLCSPVRGIGWVCINASQQESPHLPATLRTPGESHYWRFMWRQLVQVLTDGRVCL